MVTSKQETLCSERKRQRSAWFLETSRRGDLDTVIFSSTKRFNDADFNLRPTPGNGAEALANLQQPAATVQRPTATVLQGSGPVSRRVQRPMRRPVAAWAAIGVGVKRLIILRDGNLFTAKDYVDQCLSNCVDLFPNRVFMQDNTAAHKAATTKAWLEANGVNVLAGWPSFASAANPMEAMWAMVAAGVARQAPKDPMELQKSIIAAWNAVPQSTIDGIVLSFKAKAETAAENEGLSAQ